jgi:splicing factor 3A subunit 2
MPPQVPSTEIDKVSSKFFTHWDPDTKMFTVSILRNLSSL